jgi:hypothetical protein
MLPRITSYYEVLAIAIGRGTGALEAKGKEVTLAGEPTRMVHHASWSLKGGTTSFMTFPGRGMVVAVTANIANAITRDIALAIAQAFADNERR